MCCGALQNDVFERSRGVGALHYTALHRNHTLQRCHVTPRVDLLCFATRATPRNGRGGAPEGILLTTLHFTTILLPDTTRNDTDPPEPNKTIQRSKDRIRHDTKRNETRSTNLTYARRTRTKPKPHVIPPTTHTTTNPCTLVPPWILTIGNTSGANYGYCNIYFFRMGHE